MFNKLRNKFILTNLLTTTAVLVIAFSAIYFIASANANRRTPLPQDIDKDRRPEFNQDISSYLDERINEERQAALSSLLISLLITGTCVEVMVALISFFVANQAIKPVKDTYLAQKEFIANASHEIKTPLAVIQANLEAADITGNKWIDNVATKVQDLASLNNQLLTLARLESHSESKKVEKINLSEFIATELSPLTPQLEKKKITIKTINHSTKDISLNTPAFKQILNILLDNAIKYSKQKITITIDNNAIAVKNDGATISKDQLAHIFERFYQTDKTKSGVGLGLAIAYQLATDNNWQLNASSTAKSTTFTLAF